MGILHMPKESKAPKISNDLKLGPKLGGTHDDHVGLQKVAAANSRGDGMRINDVKEGKKPAILKK